MTDSKSDLQRLQGCRPLTDAAPSKGHFFDMVDINWYTLMCLSIGTPKTINFPFVSNGKFMIFRCPKNGKLMV